MDDMDASLRDRATHEPSPAVSAVPVGIPSTVTVGFTGTQNGCAPLQGVSLRGWLGVLFCAGFEWMRNGDCIGADAEAADTWRTLGLKLFLHPPTMNAKRAFLKHDDAAPPLPYLERNADIVRTSGVMVAAPAEMTEQRRGGTWSTIRLARKLGRPLCIVFPDGSYRHENGFAQAIEARRAATTGAVEDESAVRQDAP